MLRLENKAWSPSDAKRLSKDVYEALRNFDSDIGNLRVGRTAIEFDLLLNSEDKLDAACKAAEARFGRILTLRRLDAETPTLSPGDAVKAGIALFNEERYWESHEVLEVAWKAESGERKDMLHGLILVAASLVHLQRDEVKTSLSILERAYSKLKHHQGELFGVDLKPLTMKLRSLLEAGRPEFFRIEKKL